jgi:hypothetical protein
MPGFRLLLLVAALAAGPAVRAANFTDLWWSPAESGWGVNVVHQDETAVVTLHVYDADGRPTWLTGIAIVYGIVQGQPQFRGTLHRMQGDAHTGPFDPGHTRATPAGTFWLSPSDAYHAELEYHVDGAIVRKAIERHTFALAQPVAWYAGAFRLRQSLPGGPPAGTIEYDADVLLHFEGAQATIKVDRPGGESCLYRGPLVQRGRYVDVRGAFDCDGRSAGTFEVTGLELTEHGMTGHLRATRPDRTEAGRFGGPRY